MDRCIPWFLAAFFVSSLVGCTNEQPPGGGSVSAEGEGDGGTDATRLPAADADAGPTDSGVTTDSGVDPFGETGSGESCNPSALPPATTSCSIPGDYTVVERSCGGGACGAAPSSEFQWQATVTVTGTEVKLTNGTNRLLKCELSTACDCVSSSGTLLRFTSAGFVRISGEACSGKPGVEQYFFTRGMKQ